jgi:hypothetical protein
MGLGIPTTRPQHQRPAPRARPTIRVKTGVQRPVLAQRQPLAPVVRRQLRRPAWDAAVFHPSDVALARGKALGPSATRHSTAAPRRGGYLYARAA